MCARVCRCVWETDFPHPPHSISDTLGIIRAVGEAAEKNGVGIHSVVQNQINNPSNVDFVVTTELCKYSEVNAMCDEIAAQDFALAPPLIMSLIIA